MNKETKIKIEKHLNLVMDKILKRRTIDEPFDEDSIKNTNPFGYRLVPVEVWKGSKFERSFVTSLGQGIFEQVAKIIAEGTGAKAINQHTETVKLNTWQVEQIEKVLKNQRSQKGRKQVTTVKTIKEELEIIKNLDIDRYEEKNILFDLYIERSNGNKEYYSLKTVKPNLDQTEKAKRDILIKMTAEDNSEAFFALPYNPAGEGQVYKSVHPIPYKLFDIERDENVLIGKELWNKIGQSEKTYDELISIFEKVGEVYIQRIRKEYFGI
ncbi:TPA: TdeIII family type II restriction endonuclease [Clostridioides difficile]|uniref:TdeIII family type II restriction endonuclease n=1 Tax=Clostridioides difficile TaxID=1496 RepID=UPI00098011AD|nr:TdeIII family type II restriction endonuclease [Clostridioides difficile]AXU29707.1 type II restriction endonuclease [Clostridioides difficile]AXU33495.1 type II restriction endonuclease [Clostridioides difficile]AXU37281.1 type II restriction endonuclease [Clostridioides difficile]MBY1133336.1 TdeIII family type II restriction endonuclease [Clostridioides difficile]MBY1883472.1 TdeIII family type II restriction endonuclease [Clostridioides difficile]